MVWQKWTFGLILSLIALSAHSQTNAASSENFEEEFKLLDQASSEPLPAPQQTAPINLIDEPSHDQQADSVGQSNLVTPAEVLKAENALYGFSAGLMYLGQPYVIKAKIKTNLETIDTNQQSDIYQNFGFILRYAMLPYQKIGTDLNLSYVMSQNHGSMPNQQKAVNIIRGEVNLGYAFHAFEKMPAYFFGGLGYEEIHGETIENILNKNGLGAQLGFGVVFFTTVNVEGAFSYYQHRISDQFVNTAIQKNSTATIDTDSATVSALGFLVRTTFDF